MPFFAHALFTRKPGDLSRLLEQGHAALFVGFYYRYFVYFIFFSVTAVDGPVMIFARFRRVLVLFFLSFISRRQMPLPTPCPCFDFLWDVLSAELPRTPRYLDSRLDGGGLILVLPLDIWAF